MIRLIILLSIVCQNYVFCENSVKSTKKIYVKYKDTLWSLAQKEYSDGFLWEKIYKANKDVIKNPNLIFPGDEIIIPDKYEDILPVVKDSAVESSYVSQTSSDTEKKSEKESLTNIEITKESLKEDYKVLKEPLLNEEMPESSVFSNLVNKTIKAEKKYFDGKITAVSERDEFISQGLPQKGEELILKISKDKAQVGAIAEIYAPMYKEDSLITAQLCGRCEIFYVQGSVSKCRILWINGYIEEGMIVKVKRSVNGL
ncbi:MAG: LysM peptidoglycan-binding domain-containing protein [Elusimicrobiota bacterium]